MQKLIAILLVIIAGISFKNSAYKLKEQQTSDRETIDSIRNAVGEIRIVPGQACMIWCQEKWLRLNVGNLPEKFKTTGLKVVFSGNIKSTNTLEDEWGELFELTAIR